MTREQQIAIGFAVLITLAVITSIMVVRMDQATERANNRPRPRVKTDMPDSVKRAFPDDAQIGGD